MPLATGTSLNRVFSDGSPDGSSLGQSTTDLISLYGATPVAQPSGNAQTAVARGQQAGVIATYATAQTPSAVSATFSTAEQTFTIQNGTGAQMLIAAGDLLFINKPTNQAGLGVGNVRVSSSNVAGVTFSNFTSASITPTSAESYALTAIRGLGAFKISATLTPAVVALSSSAEQQFTVTGLQVGSLVQVIKPSAQAGLDIGGCRVVSNNVLGITFFNLTSAAITPTSAEAYTITALPGLDAINNEIYYGFNVGTVGAISSGIVVSGGSTTLTGLLATDIVTNVIKPTPQSAAANATVVAYSIPTANVLTNYYAAIGTGNTPTSGEIYGVKTTRLAPAAPLLLYSQTLTPVAVSANTTAEQTFTVTGLISGTPVWVNKPSYTAGLVIVGVRVSATNTLAINYGNLTSATITPPAETYTIGNFQVPTPGNGNCVYQTVSPIVNNLGNLVNAERSALVSIGALAGS